MDYSLQANNDSNNFLDNSQDAFESLSALDLEKYILRLYVASKSIKSLRAIKQIQKLCEEHLQGRYELEVVDIYQQPERLEADQVFAVPTLIKEFPLPFKKLVGDMTDTKKIITSLAL
ncbi:MAG: circadian clock protein KaiB [Fischerella sp.]|jgi:circadian clock protein KaiB|uniref:circadian clock KaiB family protein n=1 Tax=unclassified Fischerella TaxID=494603 RepID=UPI00047C7833|nr:MULTISPECIES: circadian clock KaiB family protein [unclassified Fischerella]NWF59866.1 circadian clock protein KaiB [Fischerella sp.]